MEDPSLSNELLTYWNIIRHWIWLIVIGTVVAGIAAYGFSLWFVEPVYQSKTELLVQPSGSYGSTEYADILAGQRIALTYAQVLQSRPMQETALQTLGYNSIEDRKDSGFDYSLAVGPLQDTQIIEVQVKSPDPTFARDFANALASTFIAQNQDRQAERFEATQQQILDAISEISVEIAELKTERANTDDATEQDRLDLRLAQLEETLSRYNAAYQNVAISKLAATDLISIVEPALLPQGPIQPRPTRNALLAAVVGGMATVGLVFLKEALDTSVRSPDEISGIAGAPILGQIWQEKEIHNATTPAAPAVVTRHPLSLTSEAFRMLRANLRFASVDKPIKTLLVTSSEPTEGKSTIALNLALSMALANGEVILVDADLRRPTQHQHTHLQREPGLSDALVDTAAEIETYLQPLAEAEKVRVLPAGQAPPNPTELLDSQRMRTILDACEAIADVVIIDSPPLLAAADAAVLGTQTDGVLLVVEAGSTDRTALMQALDQLHRANVRLLGVVLNKVPISGRGGPYHYYSYDHKAAEETPSLLRKLVPSFRNVRVRTPTVKDERGRKVEVGS